MAVYALLSLFPLIPDKERGLLDRVEGARENDAVWEGSVLRDL